MENIRDYSLVYLFMKILWTYILKCFVFKIWVSNLRKNENFENLRMLRDIQIVCVFMWYEESFSSTMIFLDLPEVYVWVIILHFF